MSGKETYLIEADTGLVLVSMEIYCPGMTVREIPTKPDVTPSGKRMTPPVREFPADTV